MATEPDTVVGEEIVVIGRKPAVLAWGQRVTPIFRDRVLWIAKTLTAYQRGLFDGSCLMACMAWESGRTFRADVKNMAGSGAVGLIQFMPSVAVELGTSTTALAAMTPEDQLNFVYTYFKQAIDRRGPILTLEDMYMAILYPVAVGKPIGYVLFDRASQATAYRQNAGLDTDKDGHVTKYEAAAKVRGLLADGLKFAA